MVCQPCTERNGAQDAPCCRKLAQLAASVWGGPLSTRVPPPAVRWVPCATPAYLQQARVGVEAVHGQAVRCLRVDGVPPTQVQVAKGDGGGGQREQAHGGHGLAQVHKQLQARAQGVAGGQRQRGQRQQAAEPAAGESGAGGGSSLRAQPPSRGQHRERGPACSCHAKLPRAAWQAGTPGWCGTACATGRSTAWPPPGRR